MKSSFVLIALLVSLNATAAPTWYSNLTLTSAAYYWDGSYDVWAVEWEESISTGCAATDDGKKSGWWGGPSNIPVGNARLAPALMALGAGLKVDLMIDPNNCSSKYGAILQGVRVRK